MASASCPWHDLPVDSDWERFISRCQDALGDLVEGRPEPFKELWSHADDVVIMGAFGGHERGWEQVSDRLDYRLTLWDFRSVVQQNGAISWELLQSLAKRVRAAQAE